MDNKVVTSHQNDSQLKRDDNEPVALFDPLKVSENSMRNPLLMELARELTELSKSMIIESKVGANKVATIAQVDEIHFTNLIEGHAIQHERVERIVAEFQVSTSHQCADETLVANYLKAARWVDDQPPDVNLLDEHALLSVHRALFANASKDDTSFGDFAAGTLREVNVIVGEHVPISSGAIPRFISRLSDAYKRGSPVEKLLNAVYAHHRLVWVHPFVDGNGRVARFLTKKMLEQVLPAARYWSLSKELYTHKQDYLRHLASCDRPRQGDRDGRGNLSEGALADFTEFVLKLCIGKTKETIDKLERL